MIQQLRNWTDDSDRAVSPVIGVILMVAITVILAAVIGSFVLGIGGDINETPQAQLSVEATVNSSDQLNVTITHDGGDSLPGDDLRVIVENSTYFEQSGISDLEVGDQQEIGTGATSIPDKVNVRLVHVPSDSLLVNRDVTVG